MVQLYIFIANVKKSIQKIRNSDAIRNTEKKSQSPLTSFFLTFNTNIMMNKPVHHEVIKILGKLSHLLSVQIICWTRRVKKVFINLPLSSSSFNEVFARRQAPISRNDSENSEERQRWEHSTITHQNMILKNMKCSKSTHKTQWCSLTNSF